MPTGLAVVQCGSNKVHHSIMTTVIMLWHYCCPHSLRIIDIFFVFSATGCCDVVLDQEETFANMSINVPNQQNLFRKRNIGPTVEDHSRCRFDCFSTL